MRGFLGFWVRAFLVVVVIVVTGVLVAALLYPALAGGVKAFEMVDERVLGEPSLGDLSFPKFPERSTIYASDGSLLATIFLEENRKYVKLAGVSDAAIQAVLAIEDDRFYEHGGVDVRAILRAFFENLKAGQVKQGGSTITQQLVKLQFTSGEDTLERKIEEAKMALALEKEYSKDEILELYLNKVYFGNGAYGIGTAAEFYFGKPASKLNLQEGALIAGLIARPEEYNPLTDPD
ncbi:MAG: transglycosylase domain-containing protein [Actinobacteria bacterium]|nr:transglycosylase domain-containing protein [Actinomycetota bacterium]